MEKVSLGEGKVCGVIGIGCIIVKRFDDLTKASQLVIVDGSYLCKSIRTNAKV